MTMLPWIVWAFAAIGGVVCFWNSLRNPWWMVGYVGFLVAIAVYLYHVT